jgi:hypothetical protein
LEPHPHRLRGSRHHERRPSTQGEARRESTAGWPSPSNSSDRATPDGRGRYAGRGRQVGEEAAGGERARRAGPAPGQRGQRPPGTSADRAGAEGGSGSGRGGRGALHPSRQRPRPAARAGPPSRSRDRSPGSGCLGECQRGVHARRPPGRDPEGGAGHPLRGRARGDHGRAGSRGREERAAAHRVPQHPRGAARLVERLPGLEGEGARERSALRRTRVWSPWWAEAEASSSPSTPRT